jgi:Signal peptidase (SPase) II
VLTGPTIERWYAKPITGALLDLLDFGLVSTAVAILARRQRLAAVTICGSLMIGGWGSNLLDRLRMHHWTAPGSIRGAVDFINIGGHRYNLADFFIIGATPLFLLAAAHLAQRAANRSAADAVTPAKRDFPRVRAPIAAIAAAGLIMTVALGAAHYGSPTRPRTLAKMLPACTPKTIAECCSVLMANGRSPGAHPRREVPRWTWSGEESLPSAAGAE